MLIDTLTQKTFVFCKPALDLHWRQNQHRNIFPDVFPLKKVKTSSLNPREKTNKKSANTSPIHTMYPPPMFLTRNRISAKKIACHLPLPTLPTSPDNIGQTWTDNASQGPKTSVDWEFLKPPRGEISTKIHMTTSVSQERRKIPHGRKLSLRGGE